MRPRPTRTGPGVEDEEVLAGDQTGTAQVEAGGQTGLSATDDHHRDAAAADVSAQQDAPADDPSGVMTFASARRASGTTR